MSDRAQYLTYIRSAFDHARGSLDAEIEKGRNQLDTSSALFGYTCSKAPLQWAAVAAFVYEQTGEAWLAQQALRGLACYREWADLVTPQARELRPEYREGVPPVDPVFSPILFVPACERIRNAVSEQEYRLLAGIMADSLRDIRYFPEWGAHNRAMLRAASLAMAARAFPEHPEAPDWASLADELAEETWGRWSVEDAALYQPHWLRSLILYAEARGRHELGDLIPPRLHLKAMAQLMTPLGILPDHGDSHWLPSSHWEWLACLEWGARAYGDPAMKWAAQRIWQSRQEEGLHLHGAAQLLLAWRWCDDGVPARQPHDTPDALDDLVTKKVVFRTGWGPDDSYACLNYRDEGDYGRIARDYLRTTLAVTAEKMHHGHADEGSFVMLVHKGSILLHESGYRENPPDGIYRSDVYHNRLVWRSGLLSASDGLIDHLRGDGYYHPLRTERLYQTRLGDAEVARVRATDERRGVAWDRTVFFLPSLPCWIVVDAALALQTETRTLSSLWWTTDILQRGPSWFDTRLSQIVNWRNRGDSALLIALPAIPDQPVALAVEPARRCFQDELAIAQTWRGEHRAGRFVNSVTVLWPHSPAEDPAVRAAAMTVLDSEPKGRGLAVRLAWQGEERLLGTLNDLTVGYLQEDIRPRYTAERGQTSYGPLNSDAHIVYSRCRGERLWTGFVNGTRLAYDGRLLHQGPLCAMFQEDRTTRPGVPARFRWEGETQR